MNHALRLAVGTLSVVPMRPPARLDRRTAGTAMALAPLVGLGLGALAAGAVWLLDHAGASAHLTAALVLGLLAALTRGMHLDGLADTADGLGSAGPAPRALEVMRRGDVGPFGVASLVLVLLVQVTALGQGVAAGHGAWGVATAVVLGRLVLPFACLSGIPPARSDGLGALVAGSVGAVRALVALALAVLPLVVWGLLVPGPAATLMAGLGLGLLAALAGAGALCLWCVRRLGGVTGDVLGGCVETATTLVLVVLALVA